MPSNFDSMSRAELQAEAKKHGIKANASNVEIIKSLKEKVGGSASVSSSSDSTSTTAASSSSSATSKPPPPASSKKRKGADEEEEDDESAMKDDDKEEDEDDKPSKQPANKKTKKGDAKSVAAASSSSAAAAVVPDLKGKKFIVMGAFDSGKYKIESEISSAGGEVTKSVLKSLNYLVYGKPEATDYGGVSGPGSKKYKEAKKIRGVVALDETQFLALIAQVKGGASDAAAPVDFSQHPFVIVFRSILKSLGIPDSELKPASLDAIQSLEKGLETAVPHYLRALLSVTDGTSSLSHLVEDWHLFPSVDDMGECGPGGMANQIWKSLGWFPFNNMCSDVWEVIDKRSGRIYYVDCDSYPMVMKEYDDSLEVRLNLLDEWLKVNKPKKSSDGIISLEKFESKMSRMSEGKINAWNMAYRKAERSY